MLKGMKWLHTLPMILGAGFLNVAVTLGLSAFRLETQGREVSGVITSLKTETRSCDKKNRSTCTDCWVSFRFTTLRKEVRLYRESVSQDLQKRGVWRRDMGNLRRTLVTKAKTDKHTGKTRHCLIASPGQTRPARLGQDGNRTCPRSGPRSLFANARRENSRRCGRVTSACAATGLSGRANLRASEHRTSRQRPREHQPAKQAERHRRHDDQPLGHTAAQQATGQPTHDRDWMQRMGGKEMRGAQIAHLARSAHIRHTRTGARVADMVAGHRRHRARFDQRQDKSQDQNQRDLQPHCKGQGRSRDCSRSRPP